MDGAELKAMPRYRDRFVVDTKLIKRLRKVFVIVISDTKKASAISSNGDTVLGSQECVMKLNGHDHDQHLKRSNKINVP